MNESVELLQHYLPTIYDALSPSKRKLAEISNRYHERMLNIAASINTKGEFTSERCIYDLWWDANEGDQLSLALLAFIDNTVKSILGKVAQSVQPQVITLCHKMIINFSHSQSQHSHFVAELAVINKLLSDAGIKLLQVERKLSNGEKIDFLVRKDGEETLIEVYNINFDFERMESSESFKTFLETRITNKLNKKLQGLPGTVPPFLLVPVLWGNIFKLDQFADAFKYFEDFSFISSFMMVKEYKDPEGRYLIDFGTVEAFLKEAKWNKKGAKLI
jgi:hypothetical protein